MTLIAIFFSLVLERAVESLRSYRRFEWFDNWTAKTRSWCKARSLGGPLTVLAVISPPVVIVGLVNFALYDVFGGLFSLILNVVILVLCLGPQDLDEQVTHVLDALDEGDEAEIRKAVETLLEAEMPKDKAKLQQSLVETILLQANERVFALLFSFLLLGPLGAVLYRLSCHMKSHAGKGNYATAAYRLHDLLAFVPAHLSALGYAMAGSFVDAIHAWRMHFAEWKADWQASVSGAALAGGFGALQYNPSDDTVGEGVDYETIHAQVKSTLGLVWRTLVIWVVLIAIFTLFGLTL
jgi:membrane protein required for beta-lactamase induction